MLFICVELNCSLPMTMFIYRDQKLVEYCIISILRNCRYRVIAEISLADAQTYRIAQINKIIFMDAPDSLVSTKES